MYKQNSTEEYLPPLRFSDDKKIQDGDSLVFFNYREDSIRQLASAFILKDFDHFPRTTFNDLYVATLSHYDDAFDVPVVFPAGQRGVADRQSVQRRRNGAAAAGGEL